MTGYGFPVDVDARAHWVDADGSAYGIDVTFGYSPSDPWAVTLTICDECREVWSFARQLLADGLEGSAGVGAVQVCVRRSMFADWVAILLTSPGESLLGEVDRRVVARFLRSTYLSVPRGREAERVDWDAAYTALLDGEASR